MTKERLMKIAKVLLFLLIGAGMIFGAWFFVPDWFGQEGAVKPTEQKIVVEKKADEAPEQQAWYDAAESMLKEKKFKAASKQMAEWVEQKPDDATLRFYYAKALFSTHRSKRGAAVKQMKKAIQLNPDYADAYYELGRMYSKLRKRDSARRALLAYLKMNPEDKKAELAKRQLRLLKRTK